VKSKMSDYEKEYSRIIKEIDQLKNIIRAVRTEAKEVKITNTLIQIHQDLKTLSTSSTL
jgi:hypothetical protein